jgi:4-carboxymuconolactone decarboxylase
MVKKAAKKTDKKVAKKPAKRPPYRLKDISDEQMNALQRSLRDAIYSGPRGIRKRLTGPFQIWLNAPELGLLAQALGAHVRYKTSLSPRLSETAILATAQLWKAHYEWFAHAPQAEKAGVKPQTVKDIQAGRAPKAAAKDELAIIDFVKEMYKTRRVSDKNYKRVHAFLGDAGVVELVGICGYYAMISMTLNVFRAQIPEDAPLPFAEPAV